jgi:hypothetical protein
MPSDRQAEAYALIAAEYRICNLVPSRGTGTDWTFYDAVGAGVLAAQKPPAAVDLRADWWDVADQDRTGSSVGWAAGDGVMRHQLVTAGRLRRDEHVSARYVWMAAKESDRSTGCPGTFIEESPTSLKAAVDVCRRYGVVTADLLPFETRTALHPGSAKHVLGRGRAAARRVVLQPRPRPGAVALRAGPGLPGPRGPVRRRDLPQRHPDRRRARQVRGDDGARGHRRLRRRLPRRRPDHPAQQLGHRVG